MGSNAAYAALSATTANTIEGTKPYLVLSDGTKLTNLDKLLGFSMPNPSGSGANVQIEATHTGMITIPTGKTFNEFITLVPADGVAHNVSGLTVFDDDGDALLGAGTATGTMKATWYNGNTPMTSADLGKSLSVCGGPYRLEVEITSAVSANTTYGAPNTNPYTGQTSATYNFALPVGAPGICYIKPRDMTVNTGTAGVDIKYANGYNPAKWEYDASLPVAQRHKGFKADAGFPTTGFVGAEFTLLGSGSNQSVFRCSSTNDGGEITLLGGNKCTVRYNSKFGSAIDIKVEHNDGTGFSLLETYRIQAPSKWAIGGAAKTYGNNWSLWNSTSFPALDYCRTMGPHADNGTTTKQQGAGQNLADRVFRQKYMYRRDELSNSPLAYMAEGSAPAYVENRFSRDVDGTFTGEWGYLQSYYFGSPWLASTYYLTAEAHSIVDQLVVRANGHVHFGGTNVGHATPCRGE